MITSVPISVKDLAEFTARSGDLGTIQVSKIKAMEGIRAHRRYQEAQPGGYRYEVAVAGDFEIAEIGLRIGGRIDGLRVLDDGTLLLDEIKSTRRSAEELTAAQPVHRAQAMIYAHLFGMDAPWKQAEIRVIYLRLDKGDQPVVLSETWPCEKLADWFDGVVQSYAQWLQMMVEWRRTRDASLHVLAFPFAQLRPGQDALMDAVEQAIEKQQRLYAEAPTGIGKTMSTLYPALRALSSGEVEKVFYLTAKNSGKRAAEDAVRLLGGTGARIKSVTITAKQTVCAKTGTPCDASICPFALGFFDRLRRGLDAAFALDAWTPEAIDQLAEEHRLCPFEFSLELCNLADLVICDYNYLFDPRVQLRRFFAEVEGAYVFLVDEAHNLPARAREMFSASLNWRELDTLKSELGATYILVRRALTTLLRVLNSCRQDARKERDTEVALYDALPEELARAAGRVCKAAERVLVDEAPTPLHGRVLDLYFYISTFLMTADRVDDRYAIYYEVARGGAEFKLLCLDPSREVVEALEKGRATVFFSATLNPLDYYKAHFGGDGMDPVLRLGSPFPPEHLEVQLHTGIATTWRERASSYVPIADAIRGFIDGQGGNFLVFFPSFAYLNAVAEHFELEQNFGRLLIQRPRMSEGERSEFLARFNTPSRDALLGFAVMGGIFGEGIDLVGDALHGAVIVGVGLPQVCLEQQLIRQHFGADGARDGFAYAYIYPGMCRVLQAAGRVIRSEEDEGRVMLIDQRYARPEYRELLPAYWIVQDGKA